MKKNYVMMIAAVVGLILPARAVVTGSNNLGLITVPSAAANTLIVVPFQATDGSDANVANFLMKDDLTKSDTPAEADQLFIYVAEQGKYGYYYLSAAGVWTPGTVAMQGQEPFELGSADAKTLKTGSALWLVRRDITKKIQIFGQIPTTVSTVITAGTVDNPSYTLCGFGGLDATDLNFKTWTGAQAKTSASTNGDLIIIPQSDGTNKIYEYMTSGGVSAWCEQTANNFTQGSISLSAGKAFWYVSRGGNPTIQ